MKFKIGLSWVKFRLVKGLIDKRGATGYWSPKKGTTDARIDLDDSNRGLFFWWNVFHELGHQIEGEAGFELTEEQIDYLAKGYTEFLFGSGFLDPDEQEARFRKLLESPRVRKKG